MPREINKIKEMTSGVQDLDVDVTNLLNDDDSVSDKLEYVEKVIKDKNFKAISFSRKILEISSRQILLLYSDNHPTNDDASYSAFDYITNHNRRYQEAVLGLDALENEHYEMNEWITENEMKS